ncbi:GntR family transcriptional regulator [Kitasatospora purpeofusca]|uniref:GntR family transcriptional regulator n=1 Tax=Kitasatospora purpeofusca TaxID=67352 RepID=UPI0035DEDBAF
MAGPKAFTAIADHYRQAILAGDLVSGEKLPTNREMCQRWNVAAATVSRALNQLIVEGLIRASPRGTFVADDAMVTAAGPDRLSMVQRLRSSLMEGETSRVTAAELVVPPLYVQDIFNLDPGDQLVRREFIVGRGRTRTMLVVTWHPAHFAAQVPDLLSTAPGKNAGLTSKILEATGRSITHARDDMHARECDAREASALGLRLGAPVLGGVHRWSDDEGVIEFGLWVVPTRVTVGYQYDA